MNPLLGILLGIVGLALFVGVVLGALWLLGWALRRGLSRLTVSPLALLGVGLTRNWLRTALTVMSITMALFLFGSLGGVLDTLQGAIRMSSETRLVTRDARSLVFFMPIAYRERLAALPGVTSVSVQNWFGGRDPKDPGNFFAQFAVDAATFFPMYANDIEIVSASPPQAAVTLPAGVDPKLAAFMSEQTACVVGEKLFTSQHWKLGQTVTLQGTIFPGDWPFTIRAVYRSKNSAFREETMFFHARYLTQKGMGGEDHAGIYILKLADPSRAAEIAKRADALFENSSQATHTETERAFQAGFVSMYGNIPFVLRVIGLAVVFSILLVAANTMMMSFRERTAEFGVLKTLGFTDAAIFTLVLAEAAVITLGGGVLGSLLAKQMLQGVDLKMLPPMQIDWTTVARGIGVAVLLGAVSGLIPAWQASRLRIVDALRRV